MFTVVIFWQDKKWNDEMECFINNNNEHIGIITLERTEPPKYDTSLNYDELRAKTIENLQKEIVLQVGAAEHWRLIFVDNYQYRCMLRLSAVHNTNECDDYESKCSQVNYECGRNPFLESYKIGNNEDRIHRNTLLAILKEITETFQQFLSPKEIFVISVRNDGFSCKKEAFIPQQSNQYWKVSEEFPSNCRYFMYDMKYIDHKLQKRELYWLYCLIMLLAQSELHMDQFQPRCMYRLKVGYSVKEYYQYLESYYENIEKQITELNVECQQLGKNINERGLLAYPLTLSSITMNLKYDLNRRIEINGWEKTKIEIRKEIWRVCHDNEKDYEEQWKELRKEVSADEGENAELYEEEKVEYENTLFSLNLRDKTPGFNLFDEYMEEKELMEKVQQLFDKYDIQIGYRMKWKQYVGSIFLLTVVCMGFYIYILYIRNGTFEGWHVPLPLTFLLNIFCMAIYFAWGKSEEGKMIGQLQQIIKSVDNYQDKSGERSRKFLQATRDTMLYWKRVQNLENYKKETRQKKKEMYEEIQKLEQLKKQLSTLLNLEKEAAKRKHTTIGNKNAYRDILVNDKKIKSSFTFIEEVKFKHEEGKRGRDT